MRRSAPKPPSSLFVVTAYALIALCLIALAIFGNPSEVFGVTANTMMYRLVDLAARVVMLAVATWLYIQIRALLESRWKTIDINLSPGPPRPEIAVNDLAEQHKDVVAAISLIRQRYNSEAIGLFTKLLAGSHYQVRVTERAELLGSSARMCVSTDYAISAAERQTLWQAASSKVADSTSSEKVADSTSSEKEGSIASVADGLQGTIPVPVLKATKGTLLDNLEVTDYNDASLSVLSQQEARGLVLLAVETLFYLTFDRAEPGSDAERQQEAALWSLHRFVSQMGRITIRLTSAATSITQRSPLRRAFLETIENLLSPVSVERLEHLEAFCCFFAQNYVVVADIPLPPGVRFIVKYSKSVPLYGRTLERDQRRTRLGLVPYKFRVPLNLAFTAESYHFRMDIDEGRFVADQYLVPGPADEHLGHDDVRSLTNDDVHDLIKGVGYVRIRPSAGLPYAHLYARGLHKSDPADLVTVVRFAEVPPGALGATTVVAAVSAALVTFLTFVPATSNGPSADTSALLFAVPLFAATLVGHSIDRVERSSLATYLALAVTGATAFLGAVLFGLVPNLFVVKDVSVFGLVTVPSINVGGLIASVVAVSNVIFLRWLLKYKTRRYLSMLQRRDHLDTLRR